MISVHQIESEETPPLGSVSSYPSEKQRIPDSVAAAKSRGRSRPELRRPQLHTWATNTIDYVIYKEFLIG